MIKELVAKPWRVVLVLGTLFGIALALIVPPMMVADEGAHFFRAYEVSEGRVLSRHNTDGSSCGQFLPSSLVEIVRLVGDMPFNPVVKFNPRTLLGAAKLTLDPDKRSFLSFVNTALYSPVPYAPQALGFAIGRAFGAGPLVISYCGRLLNLIVSVCIMSLAVYLIPVQKWALAILCLLPMTIFQCASLSADGITISTCLLFISIVLRTALVKAGYVKLTEIVPIVVVGALISLTKSSYTPLLALSVIIPSSRFKRPVLGRAAFISTVVLTGLLAAGVWTILVRDLYVPLIPGIKPKEQLDWILANPVDFVKVLKATVDLQLKSVVVTAFGRLLGWNDTVIPYGLLAPMFLLLPIAAMTDKPQTSNVPLSNRAISLTIWLTTTLLIIVMMYLSWTPTGAASVEGLQGRYFLPIMPLLLLPLTFGHKKALTKSQRFTSAIYALCTLYSVGITVFLVANRYYGA